MKIDVYKDVRGCIIITTLEPVSYTVDGRIVVIPPGYVTDGLSVPRMFWPVLSPYKDRRTIHASTVHDHQYEYHTCTRPQSDAFLRDDLVRHGFPLILSYVIWICVRLFGWTHW